ncbi:unnamed protein product [Sphenostylis stenocarpa]|uniref:Uncharacterized protein n=1 Tax=Sphenostylis stenocarpa TaxID=92480 RepID=A0AA86SSF2_9FABA|nr:unnamed protein product [Sphenostylis stenocarpa]
MELDKTREERRQGHKREKKRKKSINGAASYIGFSASKCHTPSKTPFKIIQAALTRPPPTLLQFTSLPLTLYLIIIKQLFDHTLIWDLDLRASDVFGCFAWASI